MKLRLAVGAAVLGVTLSGCGLSLESVPMPSLVNGSKYPVNVVLANALNLPEGAPVKLNGTVVGVVEQITVVDYEAHLRLGIREGTAVPRGSRAEVRTTAPMGEAYVELTPPDRGAASAAMAAMADGDTIPLDHTLTQPDVSDLLTALSASVTGGPFADISTIIEQLNVALHGHEGGVGTLLSRLDTLVRGLNAHKRDFDRLLTGVNQLAGDLARSTPTLARALDQLGPAIDVLASQRETTMAMLTQLTALGDTSMRLLATTKESIVRQAEQVGPVLQTLIANMDRMTPLMQGLVDFAHALDSATPGDFARFDLTALFSLPDGSQAPAPGTIPGLPGVPSIPGLPGLPLPPLPTVPGLPSIPLPSLPGLPALRHGGRAAP